MLRDTETPKLVKRLVGSGAVLLVLMYLSMGHLMWGFPAPAAFDNLVFLGVFEMLLAIVIMMIHAKFFKNNQFLIILLILGSILQPSDENRAPENEVRCLQDKLDTHDKGGK